MNTNPNAKVIVCYGDSNTWGDVPNEERRYASNVRWPGVLQDILGNDYEVVNEGLCGRTFKVIEPGKEHRSGIDHLRSILQTNEPTDLVTIMLGTNDLKNTFGLSAEEIAHHLRETIEFIQNEKTGPNESAPQILIICPTPVATPINGDLDERMIGAHETSLKLPPLYKKVAEEFGCLYLNAGDFISLENTDGYHLAEKDHKALGEKVAEIVKQCSM